jgi:signal transduction histidine kinase
VITCDSTEGQGTVFTLALPKTQPAGRERILQA